MAFETAVAQQFPEQFFGERLSLAQFTGALSALATELSWMFSQCEKWQTRCARLYE